MQMADTQLGLEWDNHKWDHEAQLATEAVRHINSIKPKFAIICGDLVNYLPVLYPNYPYVAQSQTFRICVPLNCLGLQKEKMAFAYAYL